MRSPVHALSVLLACLACAIAAAPAAAADPQFDCQDQNTSDDTATPWFDGHYTPSLALSRSLLDRHIPQGLATWPSYFGAGQDLLVYSAYNQVNDGAGGRARIQGIDPRDGSLTNYAQLRASHAGGVAVVGRWVFVADANNTVYRYRADRVAAIFRGQRHPDTLDGAPAGTVVGAGFLTSDGQSLWAGTFNQNGLGVMHRYTVDGNGNLHAAGGNIEVPKKTQGLLVLPNYFVFSTSYMRTKRSNIYVVKRGYPNLVTSYGNGNLRCVRAPTMSDGVAITGDRVYQLFESGADCYRYGEPDCGPPGAPTRVITHLYSTPRTALVKGLPVFPH